MPDAPTAKYGIEQPADGDFINDWPAIMRTALQQLDALIASASAADPRPAAGLFGRVHRAPDGTISFDTGAAWVEIARMGHAARHASGGDDPLPADSIVAAMLAANAVTNGKLANNAVDARVLADGAVDTAAIVDGAVNSAKVTDGSLMRGDMNADVLNAFLKLLVPGDRKVAFAQGVDSGGWGIAPDKNFTVAHGLGAVPVFWIAWASVANSSANVNDPVVATRWSHDAVNLTMRLSTVLRGNCNFPGVLVSWLAIA